ncbi:hypothetical protein AGMMS50268_31830 [Spirochaetia bacterium]|nr:hypothetical protein AGMMS50268_31830 [Spirochaetia bacterium]
MIQGDLFAIDSCKLPSNASKEWSGTIEDFKKKKEDLEKFARKLMGYNGLAAADSAHQIIVAAN